MRYSEKFAVSLSAGTTDADIVTELIELLTDTQKVVQSVRQPAERRRVKAGTYNAIVYVLQSTGKLS